jgi:hypothetical protein
LLVGEPAGVEGPGEVEVTRGLASPSRPGGLNRGWPGKSYRNAAGWPKHIEKNWMPKIEAMRTASALVVVKMWKLDGDETDMLCVRPTRRE